MTQINFRIEEDIKENSRKSIKRYGTHDVFGNNNVSC